MGEQPTSRVSLIDRIHNVMPLPSGVKDQSAYITKQYDTVLRGIPHGVCLLTFNWQIVWVNDSANQIFRAADATAQELTGQSFLSRFPGKEDFDDYVKEATKNIRMLGSDSREVQLVKTDGGLFWCEISLVRLDPSATAPGFIATLTDKTERHRAEQKLLDSEKRFRSLVQNSTDMLLVYGADGRITYANPAVERILGFSPDEMIGRGGYEVVHPEDMIEAKGFFKRLMTNPGKTFSTEFRVSCKDGGWKHIEGVATNLLDDSSVNGIVSNSRDVSERNEAIQALMDSEAMYGSLVESLAQNVFRKDLSGRFLFVNSKFCRLVGKSAAEIVGKTDFDLFPAHMAAKFQEDDMKVMRSGESLEIVEENKAPDGSKIYVQVVKTPVHDARGNIVGLQGIFWDITERRNSEEALKQSEERYRSFVDNLPLGVYRSLPGTPGKFLAVNPMMAQMLGYDDVAELMETPPENLFKDAEQRAKYVEELSAKEQLTNFELELKRKNGESIWTRNSARIARDAKGRIEYFDGMLEDITESRRTAAALKQSEDQYSKLINNTTDGVYQVDLAGNLKFANPALLEMIGYEASEVHGINNRDFMDAENSKQVYEAFHQVYKTGEAHKGLTYGIVSRTGEHRIVDGSTQLIRNELGEPIGFLGVVRDITEKRKAAQALEERSRQLERANQDLTRKNIELDEFTYIASHDLQEPLRKLTAFSDFLKKDLGENLSPRVEKDLHFIVDAAQRMQILVQDLLQLSRAGKTAITREKISLMECAQLAQEALEIRIQQSGAIIEMDELPTAWGDKTMITQLYQNLIGNALKFIEQGVTPHLRLTFEMRDGQQVFGVKDNGIGIKPDYAEQIFAPFKRLHGRDKYEGSGIGLAICRKWVERLGGTIWVESQLGEGAHFLFTLGERSRGRHAGENAVET